MPNCDQIRAEINSLSEENKAERLYEFKEAIDTNNIRSLYTNIKMDFNEWVATDKGVKCVLDDYKIRYNGGRTKKSRTKRTKRTMKRNKRKTRKSKSQRMKKI